MNFYDICGSCSLCDGAKHFKGRSFLYGDRESKTLLVASALDLDVFLAAKEDFFLSLPSDIAITFSVRCLFDDANRRDDAVDTCSIYTRVAVTAFSHLVLTHDAARQLGIAEMFAAGECVPTPFGIVLFIKSVIEYTCEELTKLVASMPESSKAMRKQIIAKREEV